MARTPRREFEALEEAEKEKIYQEIKKSVKSTMKILKETLPKPSKICILIQHQSEEIAEIITFFNSNLDGPLCTASFLSDVLNNLLLKLDVDSHEKELNLDKLFSENPN